MKKFMIIRSASKQKGVTLLESLIGILLFSIGILAVVAMQVVAVRSVAESKYRMDASFLANEIIGQMWANRANLAAYTYTGGGTVPPALTGWVTKVNTTLAGAADNPSTISFVGREVTVTIFWQHPEEANLAVRPPPHRYVAIASIN